jgi:uncharacterized membrane protein YgcG
MGWILRRLWTDERGIVGWLVAAAVVFTLAVGAATYKGGQLAYQTWVGPASQGSTGNSMHYDDQGFPIIVQPVKAAPKVEKKAEPVDDTSTTETKTTVVQQPAAPVDPGPVIVVSGNGGTDDSNSGTGGGSSSSSSSSSSSTNSCQQSMFWASGDMGGDPGSGGGTGSGC